MSKKISRVIVMTLLCAFTLSSTLTGCSSKASTPKDEKKQSSTSQSDNKLKEYEIRWVMPNSVQPDQELVNAEMSKITKEKINATLKVEFIDWGAYDQKIPIMMASGDKLDLIFTSNWTPGSDYYNSVNKGAFLEITKDMLQKFAPNVLKNVPEKVWPAAQINGKLYAIINTQIEGRTPGMAALKKYTDKYSFDMTKVTKLEDMTPLYEKIKAGDPGIIPYGINGTYNFADMMLTYGVETFSQTNPAGIRINDTSAKVFNYYASDEAKAYFKLMRDWYQKGYIRKDAATVKDDLADQKAQKIASAYYVANPDTLSNRAASYGMKPEEFVGQPFMKTFMSTSSIISTMTAISKTSKDPERCLMLYNLMYDDKDTRLFNMMNFGIEGKHYTKKDDVVTQIPNTGYWVACGWEYGCIFNSYRQSEIQPKWIPIGPEMNNTATTSPILGFNFNPEPVKTELAQCASVINEFYATLVTGSVDTDKALPQFIEKLNKSGSDKIIAEMQKQIDDWKKTKK